MQARNEAEAPLPFDQLPIYFGEPLDIELLLNFAEVTALDMESAIQWWDETASDDWIGALESTPTR